ncbi:hypothetical protein C900_01918 [Fulvivirga imtechensis AK7]|uniref:Uncharacterized protein n=1 Tax=Fulvivirga imtechensis AK7 TaxID=1237149 RepID=L8JV01_9BACT|nr:hypothetical protein C900_01918 [Fulvivirga imtechensis AK7]
MFSYTHLCSSSGMEIFYFIASDKLPLQTIDLIKVSASKK